MPGKVLAAALMGLLAVAQIAPAHAQLARWEPWVYLPGVVDLGGPRADGQLVAMAAGRLYLVGADGTVTPFAQGPNGYVGSPDVEPYLVVAPPLALQSSHCPFVPDDVFVLDLGSPIGIVRVDNSGVTSRFATIPNVDFLFGIAFDTVGRFGNRLLANGTHGGATTVVAVDCQGVVTTITASAPNFEGGLVVAPATFEPFAGYLIGPDELTDRIWAIAPDGTVNLVLAPGLPSGGDTGVESLGFVPVGFLTQGGFAYLADRGTPDNPFPGTDTIVRLSSDTLRAAAVREGDLLAGTEGDGLTVAIRCEDLCTSFLVADLPTAHFEGHIVFGNGSP